MWKWNGTHYEYYGKIYNHFDRCETGYGITICKIYMLSLSVTVRKCENSSPHGVTIVASTSHPRFFQLFQMKKTPENFESVEKKTLILAEFHTNIHLLNSNPLILIEKSQLRIRLTRHERHHFLLHNSMFIANSTVLLSYARS